MAEILPSRRVRSTPFTPGVEAAGVRGYTVYNHMLLPTFFASVENDYRHLKTRVQVWDVAAERQVALRGPQARALLQTMTPRDLGRLDQTRCMYAPICDQEGGMINDPVVLQPGEDEYWLSIADSDVALWALALAGAGGFEVEVVEPDVSPLAVQGPLAEDLVSRVFGDGVRELGFFRCGRFGWQGREWLVARSGWSKQGGFEIYVEGWDNGMPLWEALFAAGEDLDVRAGCPNLIERIEGGLLSYGNDMTRENTPLQCGLDRYVSDSQLDACWGGRRLREERAEGPPRLIRAVEIEGVLPPCRAAWPLWAGDSRVGQVTSAAYSPDHQRNVAIGMVDRSHWDEGTALEVETPEGRSAAVVCGKFWN